MKSYINPVIVLNESKIHKPDSKSLKYQVSNYLTTTCKFHFSLLNTILGAANLATLGGDNSKFHCSFFITMFARLNKLKKVINNVT